MWERGITWFFCFVLSKNLGFNPASGIKLAVFSLNEWPSTVPHGASVGARDTVAYVAWG